MATQDYAASVQGAAIRVTRLSSSGSLLTGALDSYTTSAFIRMSFTPEYEDGEEITEKAADGTVCVSYKAPDRLKRVTMELAICEPDPELTALLAGGVLLTRNLSTATALAVTSATIATGVCTVLMASTAGISTGTIVTIGGTAFTAATGGSMLNSSFTVTGVTANTSITFATTKSGLITATSATITVRDDASVGWAAPAIGDDPAGNGVAIECWSHAVANGKRASSYPYFHWIFPYARLRQSGDRVIENGLLANTFEGYGIGNTTFSGGPDGRWAWTEVTDRPYAYARSDWSPSQPRLKGFYTWSGTTATAVNDLPIAQVDTEFNVPGAYEYVASTATDVVDAESDFTVGS
jgi:hypothetical protein